MKILESEELQIIGEFINEIEKCFNSFHRWFLSGRLTIDYIC